MYPIRPGRRRRRRGAPFYDYGGDEAGTVSAWFGNDRGIASGAIAIDTDAAGSVPGTLEGVMEGDLIKTANDIDAYLIQCSSNKRFKGFDSYRRFKWENVRIVSEERMKLDAAVSYDPDSVCEINVFDRDSYPLAR